MVRIPGFHCCGPGSIPGQGTEIPQAMEHSQKKQTNKKKTTVWPTSLFEFFCTILCKNPNELFGQLNI